MPKVNIDDIDNLKNWRNESIHENNMPEPKYRNHIHTMAQTISFFSELPIPIELNNILTNQKTKEQPIKNESKNNEKNIFRKK